MNDKTTTSASASGDQKATLLTKEGLEKLKEELNNLTNTRRKEVSARIKEAISYGDISENSEYEDAKNEQAFVEGRIIELEKMIKNAQIIGEDKMEGAATVQIGSTVTIKNLTDKDPEGTYTIVGSTEANPLKAKISNESPIGAAILNHVAGDRVLIKAPAGEYEYEIIKVK